MLNGFALRVGTNAIGKIVGCWEIVGIRIPYGHHHYKKLILTITR